MRKPFGREVQAAVLLQCRRRCAFCFALEGDLAEKSGQIAHVDDPQDVQVENAAWLCRKHHDKYDRKSRQTKGYTPGELREYRRQLLEIVSDPLALVSVARGVKRAKRGGVALDVHDRRLPMYHATIQFLRYVCQIDNLELQTLLKFARDIDEALFLFDDHVSEYLRSLNKKAMHLRAIGLTLKTPERHTTELIEEQSNLALWFTEQFEVTRQIFAPFLRIRDAG